MEKLRLQIIEDRLDGLERRLTSVEDALSVLRKGHLDYLAWRLAITEAFETLVPLDDNRLDIKGRTDQLREQMRRGLGI